MTALEIYNKVSEWFKTHEPCTFQGNCVYLSEDGNRCAVGCLIPESFDGDLYVIGNVGALFSYYPTLRDILLPTDMREGEDFQYLMSLQDAHDTFAMTDKEDRSITLQELFDQVARKYNVL